MRKTKMQSTAEKTTGGRKLAGDAALNVGERVVSQLAQFAVFVVAARTLGPAEFGIFALVSACAILLLVVAELGWAPFIMSHKGDDVAVPLQVLFLAILSGGGFAVVGGLGALGAGQFGVSDNIVLLMLLFAVWVALANASSAQKGILVWMGRLKAAALCGIAGELLGAAVALVTLLNGAGVFALAYGRLCSQSVTLALSFCATRRAPRRDISAGLLRDLWAFSSKIFLSRLMVHARLNLVTLIIGGALGAAAVGYYRAAERLVGAIAELIVVPGQLLAWTQLRRARDQGDPSGQTDRLNAQVARHLKALIVFGAPLLIWLAVMNDEILGGLLGDQWRPAASLVTILAVGRLLLFAGIMTEPLMSIVGAASKLPAFMAGILGLSVLLTWIAAYFGVQAVAWSQVAISGIVLGATIILFARNAGIRWAEVCKQLRGPILPLICGTGTIMLLDWAATALGLADLTEAVLFGLCGGIVYVAAIAAFDRAFWSDFTAILRPASVAR
ncbi:oligosaccharide flippase family protein [Yoonia sp. BS5-3]|uniref:Oligosaccharide flippase family protein n=1 Tax=Yoonia phaeophyticola TaxID=3137369 RepID=A0ABZ2V436_9RHOB